MPPVSPSFPKTLELAAWQAAIKKEEVPTVLEVEGALRAISSAYGKIRWKDFDSSLADATADSAERLQQEFEKGTATLRRLLKALLDELKRNAKKLKELNFADTCGEAAESFLETIENYGEQIVEDVQKRIEDSEEKEEAKEDGEDEEDDGDYNLKKLLRIAKKRPLKFVIGKIQPASAYPLKYQLYISRQKLNKKKVAELWPQFGKPKILLKGLVRFDADTDKFLYLSKSPPAEKLVKLVRKILKFHKCVALGDFALQQVEKGDYPELDADTEAAEVSLDEIDGIEDEGDAESAEAVKDSPAVEMLKKVTPAIQKALQSKLTPQDREDLIRLVMLARRQLDDAQESKAGTTVKDILELLKKIGSPKTDNEADKTEDVLKKMSSLLLKAVEDFKKENVTDKLILSEFQTLVRRATQNIKDKKVKIAAETLRDIERLQNEKAKKTGTPQTATTATSKTEPEPQTPPPPQQAEPPPQTEEPPTEKSPAEEPPTEEPPAEEPPQEEPQAAEPPPPASAQAAKPAAKAPPPARKISPFIKFNTVRIESWNSAQKEIKSQLNAFKDAVILASKSEADLSEITSSVSDLMETIARYGDEVTDALDKLASNWSKAKTAAKNADSAEEIAEIEKAHAARRQEVSRLLDTYQAALDAHEITAKLDKNPFGEFGVTTTIQTAIQKLKAALL